MTSKSHFEINWPLDSAHHMISPVPFTIFSQFEVSEVLFTFKWIKKKSFFVEKISKFVDLKFLKLSDVTIFFAWFISSERRTYLTEILSVTKFEIWSRLPDMYQL